MAHPVVGSGTRELQLATLLRPSERLLRGKILATFQKPVDAGRGGARVTEILGRTEEAETLPSQILTDASVVFAT